eukprot:scaffold73316_cov22-Tisochrysis_lutea.AAC.1
MERGGGRREEEQREERGRKDGRETDGLILYDGEKRRIGASHQAARGSTHFVLCTAYFVLPRQETS